MLGDAGANPLGAVLGLAVVLAAAPGVRDVVLVALVALNVAGELVSFSRVIDAGAAAAGAGPGRPPPLTRPRDQLGLSSARSRPSRIRSRPNSNSSP